MTKQQKIDKLSQELAAAKDDSDANLDSAKKWKMLAEEREKIESDIRKRANDLKERLANSEAENQRMRGYISRVQEDDTVREELIAIGDPLGEQQLVPKRKRTEFPSPNQYTDFNAGGDRFYGNKTNNKHWVTY